MLNPVLITASLKWRTRPKRCVAFVAGVHVATGRTVKEAITGVHVHLLACYVRLHGYRVDATITTPGGKELKINL